MIWRIASVRRGMRMTLIFLLSLVWASFFVTFIGVLLYCSPVEANWETYLALEGKAPLRKHSCYDRLEPHSYCDDNYHGHRLCNASRCAAERGVNLTTVQAHNGGAGGGDWEQLHGGDSAEVPLSPWKKPAEGIGMDCSYAVELEPVQRSEATTR